MPNKEYYQKNKEKLRKQGKIWYEKNKNYFASWRKEHREQIYWNEIKHHYGVTPKQYFAVLEKQNYRCAICKQTDSKRLSVDHNHKTLVFRGLLCQKCNFLVGIFETAKIKRYLKYIKERKGI